MRTRYKVSLWVQSLWYILLCCYRDVCYVEPCVSQNMFEKNFHNRKMSIAIAHWGRVTHICVDKLIIIGSDNGLSPDRRQASHYLNQCSIIVNWILANIFQWKFNQNTAIFIEDYARENVVCEMASTLSRPQCVKTAINNPTTNSTFQIVFTRFSLCAVMFC